MIFLQRVDARSSVMLLFLNRLVSKNIFYSQNTIALKYNSHVNFIVVILVILNPAAQKNIFKSTCEEKNPEIRYRSTFGCANNILSFTKGRHQASEAWTLDIKFGCRTKKLWECKTLSFYQFPQLRSHNQGNYANKWVSSFIEILLGHIWSCKTRRRGTGAQDGSCILTMPFLSHIPPGHMRRWGFCHFWTREQHLESRSTIPVVVVGGWVVNLLYNFCSRVQKRQNPKFCLSCGAFYVLSQICNIQSNPSPS